MESDTDTRKTHLTMEVATDKPPSVNVTSGGTRADDYFDDDDIDMSSVANLEEHYYWLGRDVEATATSGCGLCPGKLPRGQSCGRIMAREMRTYSFLLFLITLMLLSFFLAPARAEDFTACHVQARDEDFVRLDALSEFRVIDERFGAVLMDGASADSNNDHRCQLWWCMFIGIFGTLKLVQANLGLYKCITGDGDVSWGCNARDSFWVVVDLGTGITSFVVLYKVAAWYWRGADAARRVA